MLERPSYEENSFIWQFEIPLKMDLILADSILWFGSYLHLQFYVQSFFLSFLSISARSLSVPKTLLLLGLPTTFLSI